MTAKEYLEQLKELDIKIKQRHQQKEELREKMASIKGISYDGVSVQSSIKKNPMDEFVIQTEKIEKEINALIHEYLDKKHLILNQIQGMDNPDHIDLLEQRYVKRRNFDDVAKSMHLSYDRTVHLHAESLEAFEKKYKDSIQ